MAADKYHVGLVAVVAILVLIGVTMFISKNKMPPMAVGAEHSNRLANEASPYLLQHAHNPVDWYPWGDEAFKRAAKEDKPVFLSIGYSTCHWCHVMERESFENKAIAKILNEHFISIKVDREQRPDVDDIYMNAVQMMTGSGGWPLSVFLTPDGKPFYGGTYFPPEDMFGRPGFARILTAIADAWKSRRDELLGSADKLSKALSDSLGQTIQSRLTLETMKNAKAQLEGVFDSTYGGFGMAPKFPQPATLLFLLRDHHRTADGKALEMVQKTLDAMANGGIHEHLAGGFHRYSTDRKWLAPHFEKMLYDQALLGRAYVEAYQVTGEKRYADVARDILEYVMRDMTNSEGGFYSAEDADSEGKEGTFYLWEPQEPRAILGAEEAEIFNVYYDVTKAGNFEEGKSILNIVASKKELAERFKKDPAEIERILSNGRLKLLEHRATRPRPHRDDKVITSWNALMIWALAYGGAALNEPRYTNAAQKAADFVLSKLMTDGRLQRYYRNGRAVEPAFLDDYAFMVLGLLELYETTFEPRWLTEAKDLTDEMVRLFHDEQDGGFFMSGSDGEQLIARRKPAYDGAVPSGNSMAALGLLRLGRITMDEELFELGSKVLDAHSTRLNNSPTSLSAMLAALDFQIGPIQEIIIAGDGKREDTNEMLRVLHERFLPNSVALLHDVGQAGKEIEEIIPSVKMNVAIDGRATAYVCENFVCRAPVSEISDLKRLLSDNMVNEREQ